MRFLHGGSDAEGKDNDFMCAFAWVTSPELECVGVAFFRHHPGDPRSTELARMAVLNGDAEAEIADALFAYVCPPHRIAVRLQPVLAKYLQFIHTSMV